MSYIQQTLAKDEVIKYRAPLHWIAYLLLIFPLIAVSICIAVLCAFDTSAFGIQVSLVRTILGLFAVGGVVATVFLYLNLRWLEMGVTNKRVVYKSGVIAIRADELKLTRLESVETEQTFFGRLLNYGNIRFSGTGTTKLVFPWVRNPRKAKSDIETIIGY